MNNDTAVTTPTRGYFTIEDLMAGCWAVPKKSHNRHVDKVLKKMGR